MIFLAPKWLNIVIGAINLALAACSTIGLIGAGTESGLILFTTWSWWLWGAMALFGALVWRPVYERRQAAFEAERKARKQAT